MAKAGKNKRLGFLMALIVAAAVLAVVGFNWPPAARSNGDTIVWNELPKAAQRTYRLIMRGGPFPFAKDGTIFYNFSRTLPPNAKGYYREYTVADKGQRRGAKRIVCGGYEVRRPDSCYYSPDHYRSFRQILP